MKKNIICFLIFSLTIISSIIYAATPEVQLNGEILDFTDANGNISNPQIINNRTMVPLRKIFEVLGCTIDWNGETRTVTATKNNTVIVLQIDNKIANKTINGTTTNITLDTAPVIRENRTLVPLRFIAESLEKQVAWDASTYTAIIIDYDYFANLLKEKMPALYTFLTNECKGEKNSSVKITRTYTDFSNSDLNNTATINMTINEKLINEEINQDLRIIFSGNNDLMKENNEEGWGDISLNIIYNEEGVTYQTSNEILAKLLNVSINTPKTEKYSELGLKGTGLDSLETLFEKALYIEEKDIKQNTFPNLKTEYNNLLKLFNYSNVQNHTTLFDVQITNAQNAKFEKFDLTELDSYIYGNSTLRAVNFINKKIFKFDLNLDEILYDWTNIKLSATIMVNEEESVLFKFVGTNDYDEQVEYIIEISTF